MAGSGFDRLTREYHQNLCRSLPWWKRPVFRLKLLLTHRRYG